MVHIVPDHKKMATKIQMTQKKERQQGSINIRLQQLTSLRKNMRTQVVAKRLVLCGGLCLAGGHEDAHKLANWRHWSAPDMRGRNAGGLL